MKLKVKIAGPKVHDVGYRVFLLKNAMNQALPGLSTYNWEENGQQEVVVLAEGDEARITAFLQAVKKKKPELAEVSKVTFEDYDSEVGRISEVAMFCTFVQLDKAIPLLLDIRDDIKAVRKTTDETLSEIKAVRENTEMIPQISEDIKEVRKNTDTIPQVLEEIKGMREDIQPGYALQFGQVQADVRAMKERLGTQ
ncbi:MAG: acylphosphatase [Methanothrix sp.]